MEQMTFESLLASDGEMIHCPMTPTFHWIRITEGQTPAEYADRIHFKMHGYDYLYEDTAGMEEIKKAFTGSISTVPWESARIVG